MTRTCEDCGASWGRDARWCATCGHALVEVEPTAGPTIDADDDRRRPAGRWRRWAMGVGLLVVIVAGGVLASQQVVGEGAEDDVDGGIGLPQSDPPEPNGAPRNPEAGDPFGEDPGASQPRCTRDGAEIPDCPRLLRTGLEPIGPPTDELMFTRQGSRLVAVELRTGQARWELDLAGEYSVVPIGHDVLVQSSVDGLRRVDADGQVRWRVEDTPGFHVDVVVEAGDAGTLAIVRAAGVLTARSVEDGAQLWSMPLSDLGDDFAGQGVQVRGTAGTTLLLEGWGATGTGATVVAIDAATGALRWSLPLVDNGQSSVAATTADLVVVNRLEHDDEGSDTWTIEVRDARTGTLRWDVTPEAITDRWGGGVAVADDVVVVGGPDSVVAHNLATGEVAWEAPPGSVFQRGWFGSGRGPDLDTADGAVVISRDDRLDRLDPSTGEVLWSVEATDREAVGIVGDVRAMLFTFEERGLPRIYLYDLADGSELVALEAEPNILSEDPLVLLDFSRGRLLLVPDEVMERRGTP